MDYRFDFGVIFDNEDALVVGLAHTLEFSITCICTGLLWGFVLAVIRSGRGIALPRLTALYVHFFRGTPVLVQLFWIFFCLPLILGVDLDNFTCALIALTLYMGAIACESFRAAFAGVPRDHYDASTALGLSNYQRIRYILFPQALLLAIPNLLSNSVSLFKESALVSAVGMVDLMYIGQNISNRTARPLEILTAVAFMYFVVGFTLTRIVSRIEARLRYRFAM